MGNRKIISIWVTRANRLVRFKLYTDVGKAYTYKAK